jgi:hypothetical protein
VPAGIHPRAHVVQRFTSDGLTWAEFRSPIFGRLFGRLPVGQPTQYPRRGLRVPTGLVGLGLPDAPGATDDPASFRSLDSSLILGLLGRVRRVLCHGAKAAMPAELEPWIIW